MPTALITDHGFPSIDLERKILETAGFALQEVKPICKTEDDVIRAGATADVLIVQWAPISRRVFESLPQVRGQFVTGLAWTILMLKARKILDEWSPMFRAIVSTKFQITR